MIKVVLPIYWDKTKSSTVLVSMNAYRNWHYHTSNKFKKDFHELVRNQLGTDRISGPYELYLELYYKNSNCDGSNIIALMEKVVLDAFQEHGIIESDTVKHHLGSSWKIIQQDKENPRCVIQIKEMNP